MTDARGVSVIIPTWNGEPLLRRNLPALRSAMAGYVEPWEVIIVDDGGTDGTGAFVREEYPEFRLVSLKVNAGFGEACNTGVREARHGIVYLLNNDVEVRAGFLEPLVERLGMADAFAAGSVEVDDGQYSLPRLRFSHGTFLHDYVLHDASDSSPAEVFFVSAGHAAYDRARFLELGGFDPLFRPYYWEDADICYRAWKMGWSSVYVPASAVTHWHGSTIGRMDRSGVQRVHWRNRFLFTWKNLDSPALWLAHILALPFLLALMPLRGNAAYTAGFFMALGRIGEVKRKQGRLKDADVLPGFG
ncbi:MAG: glycosyltransferase family 2 protein [Nitrospirae bacterium]|nr:glycosyltransferase family 2 protein [Nitrospirota bacterium]MBI5694948.1 glycosyltransferase family 2 protein [Nitrospirota bacterium]